MNGMKLFGIIGILLFLFSFVSAVTVTDITTNDLSNQQQQSFAQISARLTDLANQVESYRIDDLNLHNNLIQKGDLQNIYENMVNIGKQSNLDMLTSNIVLVVVAFCLLFIAIGKNMIPAHIKEDKISTTKENLRLNAENEKLSSYIEKINLEKSRVNRGWFGFKKKVDPVPTPQTSNTSVTLNSINDDVDLKSQVRQVKHEVDYSNGVGKIAQSINVVTSKKRLFVKKNPIPVASVSPLLEPNQHLEALKKEFNDPKAKWRSELEKAKMRVDILEEMNQGLGE